MKIKAFAVVDTNVIVSALTSDSRKYGYIKEKNIKGKVLCEIPFI